MSEDKDKLGSLFEKAFNNRKPSSSNETEVTQEEKFNEDEKELIEEFENETDSYLDFEDISASENENNSIEKEIETDEIDQTVMIKINQLEDYPNQPFREFSLEKEKEMIDSIKINGIIHDLIVRPLENGKYQILSGHNRKKCALKAGLTEVPCKIKHVDDDTAKLLLIDTNLVQRKEFFASETAKALEIKKEIYKKKNVDSDFFDEISKEHKMSRGNIQRYLRLNFLIPELLEKTDNKELSIKIAEDLSFLRKGEQQLINNTLNNTNRKLSNNQVKRLKKESENNALTEEVINEILNDNKKEIKEEIEIRFNNDEKTKYFNMFENNNEIKKYIISILEKFLDNQTERNT
ncbi:MAG: ParB/RepB/Spo0J family partition protein [Clostridia bacterium]|nr:ParB/RepB/Spo0J family partition protein [Clostridia bacterium]